MGEPDCCLSCKTAASATIGNRPLRIRTVGGVGGRREYPHTSYPIGKTVGSERALIERRLLMRLVQDEEEHARADQREVEEHEERVGDALARVVAALRRGRGFGLREAQEPEKLCWIAAEIAQPGEERAVGA